MSFYCGTRLPSISIVPSNVYKQALMLNSYMWMGWVGLDHWRHRLYKILFAVIIISSDSNHHTDQNDQNGASGMDSTSRCRSCRQVWIGQGGYVRVAPDQVIIFWSKFWWSQMTEIIISNLMGKRLSYLSTLITTYNRKRLPYLSPLITTYHHKRLPYLSPLITARDCHTYRRCRNTPLPKELLLYWSDPWWQKWLLALKYFL